MRDEHRESRVKSRTMGCAMLFLAMVLAGAIRSQAQCTIDPVTGGRVCAPAPGSRAGASAPALDSRLSTLDSPHCRVTVGDGSAGSGVLVARNGHAGLVLTCSHLFDGSTANVYVTFPSEPGGGPPRIFAARVLERDRAHDLAALVIHRPDVEPIEVRRSDGDAAGLLYACGFGPGGQFRCVRGEVVGRATPVGATHPSLTLRGAVRPGDSGGAVVNSRGQLVGIVWGERDGLTYVTWGSPLRAILDRAMGTESHQAATAGRGERREKREAPGDDPARIGIGDDPARWRDDIDARLRTLDAAKQDKGDYVRRDELQTYVTRNDLDGQQKSVTARLVAIHQRVAAVQQRVEQAGRRQVGVRHGLSHGELLMGALGLSGLLAVAVVIAGYTVRRARSAAPSRARLRVAAKRSECVADGCFDATRSASGAERADRRGGGPPGSRAVAVDTPPPPQRTVPETHYVPYETDSFAKAHQWASEQVARKYPGATELLQAQESLIKQYLSAQPQ